ncbi:MAG TPA: hypothetical protein VL172_20385 [Kofleriaceae bacterium]|nr:hypothetical protein [Kofleriaceae bacterium]
MATTVTPLRIVQRLRAAVAEAGDRLNAGVMRLLERALVPDEPDEPAEGHDAANDQGRGERLSGDPE